MAVENTLGLLPICYIINISIITISILLLFEAFIRREIDSILDRADNSMPENKPPSDRAMSRVQIANDIFRSFQIIIFFIAISLFITMFFGFLYILFEKDYYKHISFFAFVISIFSLFYNVITFFFSAIRMR